MNKKRRKTNEKEREKKRAAKEKAGLGDSLKTGPDFSALLGDSRSTFFRVSRLYCQVNGLWDTVGWFGSLRVPRIFGFLCQRLTGLHTYGTGVKALADWLESDCFDSEDSLFNPSTTS